MSDNDSKRFLFMLREEKNKKGSIGTLKFYFLLRIARIAMTAAIAPPITSATTTPQTAYVPALLSPDGDPEGEDEGLTVDEGVGVVCGVGVGDAVGAGV
jgi:hypothetical protein